MGTYAIAGLLVAISGLSPLGDRVQGSAALNVVIDRVDSTTFPQVNAYVTVSGQNGLPIPDLTGGEFEVVEGAEPVTAFSVQAIQNTAEPIVLAVALDTSGSMSGPPMSSTLAAMAGVMDRLGPADIITLITFNDEPAVLTPATADKAQARAALRGVAAGGETALWDAVHEAIRALSLRPAGRRAAVVVTDGRDTRSLLGLEDVVGEAVRQNVPVFPMGFGAVDRVALERLAALTGGEAFISPGPEHVSVLLGAILDRLRHQYVVTYTSSSPADGTERQLTVRVRRLGGAVEAKAPFVATPTEIAIRLPGFAEGQWRGGQIRFAPELVSAAPVTTVAYRVDGRALAAVALPPFDYVWTPTEADSGTRTLTIHATDASGNTGEYTISLEVVPPLSVSIVSPGEGEVISGTVLLQAEVQALSAVSSVEFKADEHSLGTVRAAPYVLEWNSASAAPGRHGLTVVATDVGGLSAEAQRSVRVRVGINWGLLAAIALVFASIGLLLPLGVRARRRRLAAGVPSVGAGSLAAVEGGVPAPAPGNGVGAWLILETGDGEGQRWPLGTGETRIGRQRDENDIVLPGREVSRRHAVVRASEGRYAYVHLSQTGPSIINGQSVVGPRPLVNGDRIKIGRSVLRFMNASAAPASEAPAAARHPGGRGPGEV